MSRGREGWVRRGSGAARDRSRGAHLREHKSAGCALPGSDGQSIRMAVDGALGEETGNQGFWRADLGLFLPPPSPLPMDATLRMFQEKAVLLTLDTGGLVKWETWFEHLTVMTVVDVTAVTTDAHCTFYGTAQEVKWVVRRARLPLLQELLSTDETLPHSLTMSCHLIFPLLTTQPVLPSAALLRDSCTTFGTVSLFQKLRLMERCGGEEGRPWGLRDGTGDKAQRCILKCTCNFLIFLVLSGCISQLSPPSSNTCLQTLLIWKTGSN